jgi:hypothetical protein
MHTSHRPASRELQIIWDFVGCQVLAVTPYYDPHISGAELSTLAVRISKVMPRRADDKFLREKAGPKRAQSEQAARINGLLLFKIHCHTLTRGEAHQPRSGHHSFVA